MKVFVAVFASALAAASGAVIPAVPAPVIPAATLVRAPAHDSASIESHRLGGNFAYATAEAHAYAKVTPQLATKTVPVAETTHIHTPAVIKTVQPPAVVTTKHVAQPILKQEPVFRSEPVIGPVATHTTYEQPLYKTRHYTHNVVAQQQLVHQTVGTPVVQAAIAPEAAVSYHAAPTLVQGAPALANAYGLHGGLIAGHGLNLAAAPGLINAAPALINAAPVVEA